MSNVRRLRTTDRVFFVTVNLSGRVEPLRPSEYPLMMDTLEGSRRRLGFLLCGYVMMPDYWHGMIWTENPATISEAL